MFVYHMIPQAIGAAKAGITYRAAKPDSFVNILLVAI